MVRTYPRIQFSAYSTAPKDNMGYVVTSGFTSDQTVTHVLKPLRLVIVESRSRSLLFSKVIIVFCGFQVEVLNIVSDVPVVKLPYLVLIVLLIRAYILSPAA